MSSESSLLRDLEFHPLTPDRWPDFELLFGEHGACGGCWCMWWRLKRSQFAKNTGHRNKRMMKSIVDSGEVPGILGYAHGDPVGWCSVATREAYPALERSWTLKRIDDEPVWSVVCFYTAKPFRGKGLMTSLLKAAIGHAKTNGAKIVEGYPVEATSRRMSGSEGFTGVLSTFKKAGFEEVLRRSPGRAIMRYSLPET